MSATAPHPPQEPPGARSELAKGATIGRYVILGLIGRGGMGEVYAAYDPELDRKIAIKLLRARGGSAEAIADGRTRLLREAQAIARLSHPNVLVVFDVGTFQESVFIAMEFVEGHTLGYWIQAAPRKWREVLEVYVAAGRGLIAAHAAGLVHRDFKPENVMITRTGQVRVMDFGLAREQSADAPSLANQQAMAVQDRAIALAATLQEGQDPDATAQLGTDRVPVASAPSGGYLAVKLTQTGAILGTPAYMAPEQFAGTGGDARTDQFSFCVALYEGLYGERPFAGNNVVELMANVVGGTVRDPRGDARVPTWIRRVLLRGLSTDPANRFPSMTELLAALARDPAVVRRRALVAASGVLLVASVAVGAMRMNASHRAVCAGGPERVAGVWGPARRQAVEQAFAATGNRSAPRAFEGATRLFDRYLAGWTDMYRETCEATQVRGEQSAEVLDLRMGCLGERLASVRALSDVFAAANASVVDNAISAAAALPSLERCADVAMLRAVVKPPDDPATRAKVAATRDELAKAHALFTAGQCDRAFGVARGAADTATALGYLPVKAESYFALGRLGETCTEPAVAVGQLEEAVWAAEASHHDEVAIQASVYLSSFYAERLRELQLGASWRRHGEAILSRFPGHPILEAWITVAKGVALNVEGRFAEALQQHKHALALKQRVLGPEHADTVMSAVNVAVSLHELGRDQEAEPLIAQMTDVLGKLYGGDSTQLALALTNQGEILAGLRRFEPARAAIEKAISIWRHRDTGPFFLGYGLLQLGRLELAEQRFTVARATLEQAVRYLAPYSDFAAEARFGLAQALWERPRDRERALALANEAKSGIGQGGRADRKRGEIEAWLSSRARSR